MIEEEAMDQEQEWVSKSQLKRDSAALQDLAAELAKLSKTQLQGMGLPERIYAAVLEASAMPPKGARKRQLKFIGGLLREMDAEPVKVKLAGIKSQDAQSARRHHHIERWRERLLAEGDQALTELLGQFPEADSQQLRQLLRNAAREAKAGKPPKSARQIYQFVRALYDEQD